MGVGGGVATALPLVGAPPTTDRARCGHGDVIRDRGVAIRGHRVLGRTSVRCGPGEQRLRALGDAGYGTWPTDGPVAAATPAVPVALVRGQRPSDGGGFGRQIPCRRLDAAPRPGQDVVPVLRCVGPRGGSSRIATTVAVRYRHRGRQYARYSCRVTRSSRASRRRFHCSNIPSLHPLRKWIVEPSSRAIHYEIDWESRVGRH